MRLRHRALGQRAGAVAAALLVAAIGFGSIGDIARAEPAAGSARTEEGPDEGAGAAAAQGTRSARHSRSRAAPPIPRAPLGLSALPQNARTAPQVTQSEFQGRPAQRRKRRAQRVRQGPEHRPASAGPNPASAPTSRVRAPSAPTSRAIAPSATSPAIARSAISRRAKLPARQPQPAARLHASRPAHARRQRRDAAAAAGAALHPSRRDACDPRPHAALSAARRAQLHRHPAGQRNALRPGRNGLPLGPTSRRSGSRRSRASTI